ncbi:MAG: hypothetical protein H7172_02505 [Ferruginibacter sp.]|nr:hypothetical protein [Rhodoferax sp.]
MAACELDADDMAAIAKAQGMQPSMDGDHNGAFTKQVPKVCANGTFKGTYRQFHAKVRAVLPLPSRPICSRWARRVDF